MSEREMYSEVNALVGAIAKAFDVSAEAVAVALEGGRMALVMRADERGERFVEASFDGRTARLYNGAIRHAPE